jgi:hypothetical protein
VESCIFEMCLSWEALHIWGDDEISSWFVVLMRTGHYSSWLFDIIFSSFVIG